MSNTSLGGPSAPSWQFWTISGISLLWNGFGGYDYIMSRQRNVEYLSQMGDAKEVLAWMDAFPMWAQILWPIGVWGSVLGSVLLLMRSRHAVMAFLISLIGAIGSFAAQMTLKLPPSMDNMFGKLFPVFILAVIVFLWWYAKRSQAKGFLK